MFDRALLSPDSRNAGVRAGVLVAGAALLAAASPVFAAASLGGGCDSIARELKSIDIALESVPLDYVSREMLTVDVVDHMPEDHGAVDPVIGHEDDPTAPLLFLTPRVAHILEDVFGAPEVGADEASQATQAKAVQTPMERVRRIMIAASAANKAQAVAAPGASAGGGDAEASAGANFDDAEPAISPGPLTETFYDADTLPRFQRRMYRNDI